ncbi:hypothetical protein, partial [Pseudotabrizicola sp.]|uniref:hypothetical protein n=1 Tax=Pseudotabrizicola sp. TaxID=2939647 RepID=UPI002726A995
MFRRPPKPARPLWQDTLATFGRTVRLLAVLTVLGVPILALGHCKLVVPAQQAARDAAEVARLANCQRYAMAQVSLGNHLLTVPANGAARLRLIADISPTHISNETGLRAQPAAPHFFCIPAELGQPPFAAMSVSFYSSKNSSATPARRDLRVVHAMQEQNNIGQMHFFTHRPDWDSMAGAKDLARPHPSQPAGQMTTALATDRREPPFKASDRMIARTANPDADGFRYAVDCIRPERVTFSSCMLLIEDANTGLTY